MLTHQKRLYNNAMRQKKTLYYWLHSFGVGCDILFNGRMSVLHSPTGTKIVTYHSSSSSTGCPTSIFDFSRVYDSSKMHF